MTRDEAFQVANTYLLRAITELYDLTGYVFRPAHTHDGGRNAVYICEKENADARVIRVSFLPDRSREDFLAELEYIRYLAEHGGSVANVINSRNGNLLEEITHEGHAFFICLFEKAPGKMLAENGYRYREGIPISEYFYNCGKVLGKMHQLAKEYVPGHRRYSFFDKYNAGYINELIPAKLPLLKEKILRLLKELEELDTSRENYGMIHFDYSDGNYHIDFDTGQITVFDFDNCCFGWYMFELASLWTHGVGWVAGERDAEKRRAFMDDYFQTVLAGYRSETELDDAMLELLPLFIQVNLVEHVIDAFEVMRDGEKYEDEELPFVIKCLEEDILYRGFFDKIYSHKRPFRCKGWKIKRLT